MEKQKRRALILELIAKHTIETQEDLTALLTENGVLASQGTVSRDIRDLGLVKRRAKDGRYIYAQAAANNIPPVMPGRIIFAELAASVIVLKTPPGMAMAVAAELDSDSYGIIGTIAGDDTIFCAARNEQAGRAALSTLRHKGMII